MKLGKYLGLLVMVLVFIVSFLFWRMQQNTSQGNVYEHIDRNEVDDDCLPAFRDGGGPYYLDNAPFRDKIAPDDSGGDMLIVAGKIYQNDCLTVVPDAVLDVWQASPQGRYDNEWYRGRVRTNQAGEYYFETVIPEGYGEGTGYRPPHIHFKVFVDDREIITSQMFFPDVQGRPGFDDAYIMRLEEQANGETIYYGSHNIILP